MTLEINANGHHSIGATITEWGSGADHTRDGFSLVTKTRHGGFEGEGEDVYRVYAIVKDGIEIAYFETRGYYASHYGTDWDDVFITVYPQEVVVTQYFTSKE